MPFLSAKGLSDCKVVAKDGDIGDVTDLYFDDMYWRVRYLVVNTGGALLPGKVVLVSPHSIANAVPSEGAVVLDLTMEQVKESPAVDTEKPLSRRLEEDLSRQYGWPMYWLPGTSGSFISIPPRRKVDGSDVETETAAPFAEPGDPNLRSMNEVEGYHIQATDGEIGHVEDFLADNEEWDVHYMIVNTHNWLPGKSVVVSRMWIKEISWSDRSVVVDVEREKVRTSPEYHRESPFDREFEEKLFKHHERPGYWESG